MRKNEMAVLADRGDREEVNVHEYQAKEILARYGIPVPEGELAQSAEHAKEIATKLGGAVVVEQIFSVPGIGRQFLIGMQQKEFAVVQSTVLIIALLFLVVNLATDLLYRIIDPRVRTG